MGRSLAALGMALLVVIGASGTARPIKLDSVALKVAMIGKIAEFVRWPAGCCGLEDPTRPIEFVILGNTPLEPRLIDYYRQVRIAGHRVFLRHARELADIGQPQLLFVASAFEDDLEHVLARLKNVPVLTVSDTQGFAQRGVAVNLFMAEDLVRFEISRRALQRHRLEASYHLLSLAARLVDSQQARR